MKVLWVTNDLPPRAGGIEQFVGNLLQRVTPSSTVVVGPAGGAAAADHDADQAYATVRAPGAVLPTPGIVRLVTEVAATHRPDVVVLGATWPLGAAVPRLRRALDGVPVVALSHGLEAGLASIGGGRLIQRSTSQLAAVTTISDWAEQRLTPHVRAERIRRIPPGVDVGRFSPTCDGGPLREAWGVPADVPLVGCISRLVRRKGQDVLLRAWPRIVRAVPDAWLVLAGEGPLGRTLARQRDRLGRSGARVVLPGRIPRDQLPEAHAALDVFAMPCRTRLGGADVEGLGIVYLEAQASGVPTVAGHSGGAPEAVLDGTSGLVVDGTAVAEVADAVVHWLRDPQARRDAGRAGRAWTEQHWSWTTIGRRFEDLLAEVHEAG